MRYFLSGLGALAALAFPAAADDLGEPAPTLLQAGDVVKVARIPDGIFLRVENDPDDTIWQRLPEYRVQVLPAPSVHVSVDLRINYDDPGHDVFLQLARTSERFYVRMRWRDDSRDDATTLDRFQDAAAVQFSLGDDMTSYMMGSGPEEAVNIWYWPADGGDVQDLAAGGFGSTTRLPDGAVTGAALYDEARSGGSEWVVVMSRPIAVSGEHQVSFEQQQVPAAFAVWQGSDGQRDGFKHVSDGWILLDLEEG